MNKSLLNKGLFLVVFVVWTQVLYKYWFSSNSSPKNKVAGFSKNTIIHKAQKSRKITIIPLERDPFLDIATGVKKIKKIVNKPIINQKIKKRKENFVWPTIKYLGFLKKKTGVEKILLSVNKKFKKVEKNAVILDDIKLKKVFKDSIIIQVKNKTKTIKKGS